MVEKREEDGEKISTGDVSLITNSNSDFYVQQSIAQFWKIHTSLNICPI